ncbi:TIGR00282 family metallophosphoesterase [Aneurinibacillus aneurinilyticus]|jgi:metallophosphoesterase (TIGR00282 family)|uniref:TIGR00282 family metallophosphoesterase n=2 Tax=Aneurinibacillus aneurinilyticus TaxID=1391 RepID=A0A848CM98_ANEAE|nr:TIGR00282 family metallophosphoesterase [Aneurinibacillus aneurinilyticus]ERI08284.1 putative metallophosphoesterase [Aneurinibacillus aneurinilyticus ATCC 12856]MCI1692897.1 TIGR00282 family metallophosphoesterase [Aneurinibacillus aneurinilyticus]MED0669791.1 TIGR00282 family metallophosphoesterase [Aneurinibacillus aneurinilyticus]MED0705700.1 TIGR00282 family metallophosphoesterase [Aneurinibacillus aneurinilyticus]MED0725831.1 TIGR00282 family metallophosphoesterase [Aneurinibacillus a
MRLLFIGDVVGSPGRDMLKEMLPRLKKKYNPHVTVVNGENAASGRGITQKIANEFFEWGAGAITLGNHSFDNKEVFDFIDNEPRMVRPANFPEGTPGRGYTFVKATLGGELAVINLQGRTFLPPSDCPFRTVEKIVEQVKKRTPYIFVDMHAEATSEKQAMGWFLNGKVSAVVGTHTHVQTADERILPGGTAYLSDVGMVGPRDSILGMDREAVLKKFLTGLPVRFEVAMLKPQLNGVIIDMEKNTGRANSIQRIIIDEDHPFME